MYKLNWLAICLISLFLFTCGSDSSDKKPKGIYKKECTADCKAPTAGPCKGQDESYCMEICVEVTDPCPADCVTCLLENSDYVGIECTCYGKGCIACPFKPGATCLGAQPDDTCEAKDEKCDGYSMAGWEEAPCTEKCKACKL